MAMRKGSGNVEGIRQRRRGGGQRSGQGGAESLKLLRGEMRDVGEGAGFDFAVLAIGFAKEDGGRGVAIGHGGNVHAYIIRLYMRFYKHNIAILHAYIIGGKNSLLPSK
jgi:hypothetical protein